VCRVQELKLDPCVLSSWIFVFMDICFHGYVFSWIFVLLSLCCQVRRAEELKREQEDKEKRDREAALRRVSGALTGVFGVDSMLDVWSVMRQASG
jgi:hypothetical protein